MANVKISELPLYVATDISDGAQAFTPLDDLTVGTSNKTKRLSYTELCKYVGGNLTKLTANAGTLTTSTPFTLSQGWNAGAVVFGGVQVKITDSASAAGSKPFEVLGGGAGATSLFSVDKAGNLDLAGALSVAGTPVAAFKTITVTGQADVVADSIGDTLAIAAGTKMAITTDAGTDTITLGLSDVSATARIWGRFSAGAGPVEEGTAAQVRTMINVADGADVTGPNFKTIAVSGQTSIVAGTPEATLTVAAGTNIALDTNGGVGPLTITATGGGASNSFATIAVSGQSNVVADSSTDTLTLVAGTRLGITTDAGTDAITLNYPYTFATLTVDSATPSVSGIEAGKSANTVSTTITNFTGGVTGQKFTYHINDANTGIADNANISLIGGQAIPASSSPRRVAFQYDGTQWQHLYTASDEHQFSQSVDGSNNLTLENSITDADITFKANGTGGLVNLNVNGTNRLAASNTGVDITGTLSVGGTAVAAYKTIAVSGQTSIVAGSLASTLTIAAGTNITLDTNAGAGPLTITAASGGLPSGGTVGDLVVNTGSGTGAWSSVLSVGANGATITGGTVVNPATPLAITQTWNDAADTFDAFDVNVTNTASAAASRLINLRVGGTSQFRVSRVGLVTVPNVVGSGFVGPTGSSSVPTFQYGDVTTGTYYDTGAQVIIFREGNQDALRVGRAASYLPNAAAFGWADAWMHRTAAGHITHRPFSGGEVEQSISLQDMPDTTNYERLRLYKQVNGAARIHTENGGTGTAQALELGTDETTRLTIHATTGDITLADGVDITVNSTTGTKIGTATGEKLGFWGATPVVQQILATGGGATVDNVISLLQTLGLCKQS